MGLWTSNGLIVVAAAVQSLVTYVGISPGCGTLAAPITAGTPLTSLPLNAGLAVAVSSGQGLTVTDGTHSETVTIAAPGAAIGATAIPITSWTPANSYAASTTGVCPTPQASDTALYNETQRLALSAASAGSNPGESLLNAYFDGTQPTALYLMVGWFGGATATSTPGTGTLMAEDIEVWNHTQYNDTNMYQGDGIV